MLHSGAGRDGVPHRGVQERQDHEENHRRHHAERPPDLPHQGADDQEVAHEGPGAEGGKLGQVPPQVQAGQNQKEKENRRPEEIVQSLPPRAAAQT